MRRAVTLSAACVIGCMPLLYAPVANAQATDPVADAARTAAPFPRNSDVGSPRPDEQLAPAPVSEPDHKALEPQPVTPDELDAALMPGRRRPGPGQAPLPERATQDNPGAVRPPTLDAFPTDEVPIPDRWRLVTALCADKSFHAVQATCHSWRDPYHQNTLKGDRPLDRAKLKWLPIHHDDWFFVLNGVSDTVVEPRSFPTPVGVQTTSRPGSTDVFGISDSLVAAQTFTVGAALIKGSTAFKPPEIEYRVTLAYNFNYVDVSEKRILSVKPSAPSHRSDAFLGVQEAFVDRHLRNVSERYDFDSIRIGIQPFQADFRGFLFNDNQLGIRLFGNRDNNRVQYNLAAFWRLEKDTNSGLNDLGQSPRNDWVFLANLYRQDLPIPGFTSQISFVYNRNREREIAIDHNGFPVRPALIGDLRPRAYDVFYLGYNGDGHIGRLNLTTSAYLALGQDRANPFTSRNAKIRAFMLAAEPSWDFDWIRVRGSALYASGDSDPYDGREGGFDAILENPMFAGADTSYWIRQTIPLAGGGRAIAVNGRNGLLADLRSSKDEGQSNFTNPGTVLLGMGADADITPRLRVSANANHLSFANTAVLRTVRMEGSIPREIGWDVSASAIYRPKMTQNLIFRASGAVLQAGDGFRDLFAQQGRGRRYYSILLNGIVAF